VTDDIDLDEAAADFAEEVHSIARSADNEEELRIDMEKEITKLANQVDLNVDPKHERTLLSGGRYDSLYGDLVIEYKDPTRTDNWQQEALFGRDEDDRGLIDYMYEIAKDDSHDEEEQRSRLDRMVGVGTNGYKIFFCRYQPEKKMKVMPSGETQLTSDFSRQEVEEGVEVVDEYSIQDGARRFITYLRSLQRKPLSSEDLVETFGSDADTARDTVSLLYDELQQGRESNERVEMLYDEWERMFGIVYGEELDQVSDDREEFGVVYGLDEPEVRPLLFAVHTYYALFMKILVRELTASVAETPITEAELYEPDDDELRRKLRKLESGREFELVGLENFFEEGFFAWYLDVWNPDMADQVRTIESELQEFESATPTIKPEAVRDLLKDLYQELVPRTVRHDLGEYLTPDWLAEYTIEKTGYTGDGRMLDPACGSGTFLVECIREIRQSSELEGDELLKQIRDSIVGFDLNPIAVIASRTNYLMALGEIAFESDDGLRIPVYQCDSVLTPSKYVDASAGFEQVYKIPSTEGDFRVPAFEDQERVETIFDTLKAHIDMGSGTDEFLDSVSPELDIPDQYRSVLRETYDEVKDLDDDGLNGIWAQLLRNRLAPEFASDFDYVIGNPPWVDWANLSQEYREITDDVWEEYDLFEQSGYDARTTHDDICILMTYVAADQYLDDDGELGFLLPQTLFQTVQGGHGFRRLTIPKMDNGKPIEIPLKIGEVDDLSSFDPFDASNRTAVVKLTKGEETEYPVPYRMWDVSPPIKWEDSLDEARDKVSFKNIVAEPIQKDDPRSPWISLKPKAISALRNVLGESNYTAREGINTLGADGIYHIDLLEDRGDSILIQNDPNEGKKKSIRERGAIKADIDKEIIYPMLKGRNIHGWDYDTELHILLPHENKRGPHNGIPENEMRTNHEEAYKFFQSWEDILRSSREQNSKFYDEDKDPFYLLDNIGKYTFSSYKTVWQRKSSNITATVLEPTDAGVGEAKPLATYDTVMSIASENENEAHYTCAMMNSSFSRLVVRGYTNVLSGLSSHILENVSIPEFDPDNSTHKELAELSKEAHAGGDIGEIESEIDIKVSEIWDISDEERKEVKESLDNII